MLKCFRSADKITTQPEIYRAPPVDDDGQVAEPYSRLQEITLPYHDVTVNQLKETFEQFGVCVITDVFDKDFTEGAFEELTKFLEDLGGGADRKDPESFTDDNCLPQTRLGMHHCGMSNTKNHWAARTDDKIQRIFQCLYLHEGSEDATRLAELELERDRLMVSGDGLSYLPDAVYDWRKDWPHIDQSHTDIGAKYNIQGQVVLSHSKHQFRCSPMSHLAFNQMKKREQWSTCMHYVYMGRSTAVARTEIEAVGGEYQVTIPGPPGSFIVWDARVVHSNYTHPGGNCGPRAVLYVSCRPKHNLTPRSKFARSTAFFNNLTTSHWGDQIGIPMKRRSCRSELALQIQQKPEVVYSQLCSPPELTELVKSLACITDCLAIKPQMAEVIKLFEDKKYTEAAELSMELYGEVMREEKQPNTRGSKFFDS